MSFNVIVEEELVEVNIQDAIIAQVFAEDTFYVTIEEEIFYLQNSEEVFNVSISEEVFKEIFTEIERIVIDNRFDIDVLNKAERQEIVYDSPNIGDITIYYGIAQPLSLDSNPVWLMSRRIYLDPDLDSGKKFASASFDQIWDNYLTLPYI